MSLQFKTLLLFIFITSNTIADNNNTTASHSYLDEVYNAISTKVIDYSNTLDSTLSNLFNSDENNSSKTDPEGYKQQSVDTFFQNEKFIDETQKSFVRVRLESDMYSIERNKLDFKASAHFPLSTTQNNLNIFIDDITQENVNEVIPTKLDDEQTAPQIGINYFAPKLYDISSKYSVGVIGFYPFLRARYKTIFKAAMWEIEPVQTFTYSSKSDFKEQTDIYFDRQLLESSLFRILLHRKTASHVKGMDYRVTLKYFYSAKKSTGLNMSQSFFGNTEYMYNAERYRGINNYTTSLSWRKSVWRKWFFYELQPGVNFHKKHEYRANYALKLFFDFYFGELK